MRHIALADINSLSYPAASTLDDSILSQVLKELQDLKDEHESLKDELRRLGEENQSLREALSDQNRQGIEIQAHNDEIQYLKSELSMTQTSHVQSHESLALDIAHDRKRISRLERRDPQPLQKDRGEILRALIVTNDGKMLAKEARKKMRLDKATFSRLLSTLDTEIGHRPYHLDCRQKVIFIK